MNRKNVILSILFNLTSPFVFWLPFRIIRSFYLRLFCKQMGSFVYVGRNIDVREPINITIGDGTIINKRAVLDGRGGLTIGRNVDIAQDAAIWTEQHDYNDDYHKLQKKQVVINDYVWVSSRAIILPGTTLDRGCVVAAGAVVTRDVPPMVVVGGVPAKHISERRSKLKYEFNYRPKYRF